MQGLRTNTVRGRIRGWIEAHAAKLGDDVLEIGSRMHTPGAWWVNNRDLARGAWLGMDMQPGHNVDAVFSVETMPSDWAGRFSGVLCSEVLEHVSRPWAALPKVRDVLRPGGWIVVTTLFSFPVHAFPSDFYRYTREGLHLLLADAGFDSITTAYAGNVKYQLNDHGERGHTVRDAPMHVFAVAQRPC